MVNIPLRNGKCHIFSAQQNKLPWNKNNQKKNRETGGKQMKKFPLRNFASKFNNCPDMDVWKPWALPQRSQEGAPSKLGGYSKLCIVCGKIGQKKICFSGIAPHSTFWGERQGFRHTQAPLKVGRKCRLITGDPFLLRYKIMIQNRLFKRIREEEGMSPEYWQRTPSQRRPNSPLTLELAPKLHSTKTL